MSAPVSQSSARVPPNGPSPSVVVKRIRFVDSATPGARVRREFKHPRPRVAVEEVVGLGDLPAAGVWPEPTDHLDVVFVPRGAAPEWQRKGDGWLASPDQAEAAATVLIEREGYTVQWRPGRALVQGRVECPEAVLAALVDFALYEGELRDLEQALEAREADALADVARAHRIRFRDRKHWARLGQTIEDLARMRLRFARLEPRLAKARRALPVEARRLTAHLLARADVQARLEAFSDRLEACEDLYEGANDRVADYRWYVGGHGLEITIIGLLLLEVVLMGAELYLRYIDYVVR
jgi:hypothetical protein